MAAPNIPVTYTAALEEKRKYRKTPGIDKIKFLTSCNTAHEWKKAAMLLDLVNSNRCTIQKAAEGLRQHLNMRRLQRQILFWLQMGNWADFEKMYPAHAAKDKMNVLLGSLGQPIVLSSAKTTGWFDPDKEADPVSKIKHPHERIVKFLADAQRFADVRARLPTDIKNIEGAANDLERCI
jgi:hypothetical protein